MYLIQHTLLALQGKKTLLHVPFNSGLSFQTNEHHEFLLEALWVGFGNQYRLNNLVLFLEQGVEILVLMLAKITP